MWFCATTLLAQQTRDGINQWLDENPMVLGSLFLAIGGVLTAYAIAGLKSGKTRGKYGREHEGGSAQFLSIVRLLAGLGFCGFALYKMFGG